MKDLTAVACHNIAKYNREHREPEMTPLEAAKNLAFIVDAQMIKKMGAEADGLYQSVELAASYLRKIANGELKEVVRGTWITDCGIQICSNCGEEHDWQDYRAAYCDCCGAKMEVDNV